MDKQMKRVRRAKVGSIVEMLCWFAGTIMFVAFAIMAIGSTKPKFIFLCIGLAIICFCGGLVACYERRALQSDDTDPRDE